VPASPPPGPLTGVRVLDLTQVVSGPICGRLLADLGADVVKLEPPAGDVTRTVEPEVDGMSVYFAQMNAGKRNISLDLKAPGAVDVVRRIVARCDVLLENFRPGVLARMGLDPDELLTAHPRLVICSISGWGQDGPWAQRQSYGPLVHAEVGLLDMTARLRGIDPMPEVHQHGDVYPGLLAANAILAALLQRERTGRGTHVDVSLAEALVYADEWAAVELQRRWGRHHFDTWTHPIVRVADGTAVVLLGNPERVFPVWVRAVADAAEADAVLADPRFATPEARAEHADAVLAVLRDLMARVPDAAALERAAEGSPMLVAPLRSVADLADTEWATERGLVAEPAPGVRVPAAPFRIAGASVGPSAPPARRGQHNAEVLAELAGITPDELVDLVARGVVQEG
jgi:CoA:oxalate CoA-transferase